MVAEGCAGVVGSLGYQNDRKYLFPFGYDQKTLYRIGAFRELSDLKSRAQSHQNKPKKVGGRKVVETPLVNPLKMPQKVRKTPTFVVKVGVLWWR